MRFVAFLGGVNVGGHRVKMDRLRDALAPLGYGDVSTFIASGNVIFTSKQHAATIEPAIEARLQDALGYGVPTFVRRAGDLDRIASREPWGDVPEGHTLMVWMLRDAPDKPSAAATEALSNDQDRFMVVRTELYQQVRGGFSDSSVKPAVLARALGRPATARN
ncbi:MAG TPA: DUF1697 domain-containing protein, partial [Gaiellaceae bacterium]|nr:DUF1697 domain-containing protein [Gaiellaceae bacterium]